MYGYCHGGYGYGPFFGASLVSLGMWLLLAKPFFGALIVGINQIFIGIIVILLGLAVPCIPWPEKQEDK